MRNSVFLFIIATLFIGCTNSKVDMTFKKPKIQIPKKQPEAKKNKGSLYSMQGASLFADKKDLQIGDIILINIKEDVQSNSSNKRELSSTRANSLGGGLLAGTDTNVLGATTAGIADKFNRNLGVGFSTNSSTSDKGATKTQFDETFETSISAIIEETYQNGNYYIKGSKELLIDGQKQEITVAGVIRPYDITSDNSIDSTQIANLKVLYNREGEETDVLDTPWGIKLLRKIWPF